MSSSLTYRPLPDDDHLGEDSEDTSLYDDRSSDLVSVDERSFDETSSLLNSAPRSRLPEFLSLKGITDRIVLFRRHGNRSPLEQDLVRRLDIFLMTFGCISQGMSLSCWVPVKSRSILPSVLLVE